MIEHCFKVGGAGLVFVRELCAVVVDGWVEKELVEQGSFIFAFDQQADHVLIQARPRHPGQTEFFRGFTPLYNLMAGLLEAGCRVSVEGAWAEKLPQGQCSARELALRPIFQHNLAPQERLPELAPALIEEAVADLPGRKNYRLEGDRGFRHENGILMSVLTNKAHRIAERSPLSAGLMTDYFDRGPRPASSWGEVWMGYWVRLGQGRPAGLHIFPQEIGLISDVEVHRYAIADVSTLNDLSVLDFGQGRPLLHDSGTWLGFAGQCGERRDYEMALRCCELARACARPEEQARVAEEVAHWKDWQAYVAEPVDPGGPVVFRSTADLIELVGFADRLGSLSDSIAWEIYDAESYRRQTQLLDNLLDYPGLTGRELLAAGVTPRVMEWLGLGSGAIPPPARYPGIFQIRCGEWMIWGTVSSGYMFVREEPLVLYKVGFRTSCG